MSITQPLLVLLGRQWDYLMDLYNAGKISFSEAESIYTDILDDHGYDYDTFCDSLGLS